MLRKIGIILIILLILLAMLVFTSLNPGIITVDLAVKAVETSVPVAFAVAFVVGWLFGLLCAAAFILRLLNERRQLRQSLRLTESEVSSLRSLPISDAD